MPTEAVERASGTPEVRLGQQVGRQIDVLVVDDDAVSRKVVATLLERYGHHVTTAHDGLEAIRVFGMRRFDLVLMDLHMPKIDGLEVTREFRRLEARRRRKRTPVYALTTANALEDQLRCINSGMDGHRQKPVDLADLLRLVRSISGAS